MSRAAQPARALPRRGRKGRLRTRRRAIALSLILAGFAACLSDQPDDSGDQTSSVNAEGERAGPIVAAVTLPPGGIVDTQPNSGWTEGAFSVGHDGAATYDLRLWVPAGRRGHQPTLALRYSSQGGNGPVGVGWSLSGFSTITPCPRTIARDSRNQPVSFDSNDVYCLDGMRLRPTSQDFQVEQEYRTEKESFSRIVSYVTSGELNPQPGYFKVWTKDGQIMTYGQAGSVMTGSLLVGIQPENPALQRNPTPVKAAWALNRIEDRNGNAIDIEYERIETPANKWSVELRPKAITYGPDRKVELVYEGRPDPIDGFRASSRGGVHTRLSGRLKTIKMSAGAQLLREYGLAYRPETTVTGRSLLASVTECDGGAPAVCLNALQFEWSGPTNYEFAVTDTDITDVGTPSTAPDFMVGDVDADGRDDIIYGDASQSWKMRYSIGSSFGTPQATGIPALTGAGSGYRRPIRTIDYDRDGRMDLLTEVPAATSGQKAFGLYRSNGTTYAKVGSGDFTNSCPLTGNSSRCVFGGYFADVDGNGLSDYLSADVVRNAAGVPVSLSWRYRTNVLGTFGPPVTNVVGTPLPAQPFDREHQIRVTSFDGLDPDLLFWNEAGGKYEMLSWQNGLVRSAAPNLPFAKLPENEDRRDLHFADVNCDGLEDAVYPGSGLAVQLNTGAGFTQLIPGPQAYVRPPVFTSDLDLPVRIVDFNNDRCDDVLVVQPGQPTSAADFARGYQVYSWRNGGFQRAAIMNVPSPVVCATGVCIATAFHPLDYTGDATMDIAQVAPSGGPHLQLVRHEGEVPDLLVGVSVAGLGDRVDVSYTTLANTVFHVRGTCALPLICPVRGGNLVLRASVANGMTAGGPWRVFQHKYRHGRADVIAGWLGFEEHEVADIEARPDTLVTTYFDNTTIRLVTTATGTSRVYPFAHVPNKSEVVVEDEVEDSFSTKYYRTRTTAFRAFNGSALGTYLVQRDSQTDSDRESFEGGPLTTLHSRTVTFEDHDDFGNPAKVLTSVFGSDHVAELEYRNDETSWLLGLPTSRTDTSCATVAGVQECETRTKTLDYDDSGNLTDVVVEPLDDDLRLTTVIEYGSYGNISSATTSGAVDADGTAQERTVSFTYDSQDLFVRTSTNPLGHVTDVTAHAGLGVPLESKDPNLVPTTMKYDRFGRLREVNHADGYFERFTTNGPLDVRTTVPDGSGGTFLGAQLVYDVLGREIARSGPSFTGRSAVKTVYDRLGRVSQVSRPYLTTATPSFWTAYTYDNRGRLLTSVDPDTTTVRQTYRGLETHTFDAIGTESVVVERVDGRIGVRKEDDPELTLLLQTRFEYGPFGAARKVTAADNTFQTIEYDTLGRATKHTDPSTGTSTALYNAFGEQIEQINGAGEKTVTQYDLLGRATRVTSPDGVTTNTWDTAPLGKGKLQRSVSPDGVALSYTYNDEGQTTSEKWVMENVTYQVNIDFDVIGRLGSITYPKMPGPEPRFKVNYGYKPNGYLSQVTDASSSALYWRVDGRNEAGQLTKQTYGNLTHEDRTYQASFGLLDTITRYAPTGQQIRNVTYGYDSNRNVALVQEDYVSGAILLELGYDTLNRLTTWGFWQFDGDDDFSRTFETTFNYNKNGNLDSETTSPSPSRNVTYQYGQLGAPPHALTTRNGQTYTYDAAGRQITAPGRAVTYTAFNLPKRITWGSNQATNFTYDSGGSRVLKRDGTLTTITVGGLFERSVASADVSNVHYVLADGRAVAQVTKVQAVPDGPVTQPAQVLYLHDDHQGNVVQTTDSSGLVRDTFDYDPFGRRIDRNGNYLPPQRRPIRRGYTGHEHDDELDLINMRGRIFDPVARRFLTPDPFIPNPLGSQSYNRYSYVENNPTTFIDPTGFQLCDIAICIGEGAGGESGGGGGDGGGAGGGGWIWGDGLDWPWPSGYQEPPGLGNRKNHFKHEYSCSVFGPCPGAGNTDDNPGTDAGGSTSTAGGADYGFGGLPTDNWVTPNGVGPDWCTYCGSGAGGSFGPPTSLAELIEANRALGTPYIGGPVIDPGSLIDLVHLALGNNELNASEPGGSAASRQSALEDGLDLLLFAATVSGGRGRPSSPAARGVRNTTPSPALANSPYSPEAVAARVRPPYRPNPQHNPLAVQGAFRTPEPPDAAAIYQTAQRAGFGEWFGKGTGGWYRYFSDNAGGSHFSGIVQEHLVPIHIRRGL